MKFNSVFFLLFFSISLNHSLFSESNKDSVSLAKIGNLLSQSGRIVQYNSDSALYYSKLALEIANGDNFLNEENRYQAKKQCVGSLSFIYIAFKRDFDEAFDYLLQSLKLSEMKHDVIGIHIAYMGLGSFYMNIENENKALDYFGKAESTLRKYISTSKDSSAFVYQMLFSLYNQLADLYADHLSVQKVDHYTNLAEMCLTKINFDRNKDTYYTLKARMFSLHKDYDMAIHYYELICKDLVITKNWTGLSFFTSMLATNYSLKGEHKTAIAFADSSLNISKRYNLKKEQLDGYSLMREIQERAGNYKEAYNYFKEETALKDSIYSMESAAKISSLDIKHNEEVKSLKQEIVIRNEERKNNYQMIGIVVFIITFIMLLVVRSKRKIGTKVTKYLGLLAVLLTFEFISLFLHPIIGNITHHAPIYTLLILVGIASIMIPMHHKTEHWLLARISVPNQSQTIQLESTGNPEVSELSEEKNIDQEEIEAETIEERSEPINETKESAEKPVENKNVDDQINNDNEIK